MLLTHTYTQTNKKKKKKKNAQTHSATPTDRQSLSLSLKRALLPSVFQALLQQICEPLHGHTHQRNRAAVARTVSSTCAQGACAAAQSVAAEREVGAVVNIGQ